MKSIFVTGANRGIGFEITRQCLAEGCHVIATCRVLKKAMKLQKLAQKYDHLEIIKMNVNSESSIQRCFHSLHQKKTVIDLLFNNAGIMDWSDFHSITKSSLERIYSTNLVGQLLVLRSAISSLRMSPTPIVINLSSRLGSISLRGDTQLGGAIAYQCSKAALNMLTKQAAIDLKSQGITVVSISPGWVKTDMGGRNAKYETKESVEMFLKKVKDLNLCHSGTFIGEDGNSIPW